MGVSNSGVMMDMRMRRREKQVDHHDGSDEHDDLFILRMHVQYAYIYFMLTYLLLSVNSVIDRLSQLVVQA